MGKNSQRHKTDLCANIFNVWLVSFNPVGTSTSMNPHHISSLLSRTFPLNGLRKQVILLQSLSAELQLKDLEQTRQIRLGGSTLCVL